MRSPESYSVVFFSLRDRQAYERAMQFLDVPPEKCAMVACHYYDVKAANSYGMRTIYVRRNADEPIPEPSGIKGKAEGGEFDLVVDSFLELAELLK